MTTPKMVPVPSKNIVPERDVDKPPVLECINLGITFGGLKAVEDFNLGIGQTESAVSIVNEDEIVPETVQFGEGQLHGTLLLGGN